MDRAQPLPQIDRAMLGQLVERRVEPGEWTVVPITGTNLGLSGGLFRVSGTDWSVVLKILRPVPAAFLERFGEADRPDLERAYLWDREARAYESGLLDDLPRGFASAGCLEVVRRENECELWLEDLGTDDPPWDADRYSLAARHLGRFNGAYLHDRSLPAAPWLGRDWTRAWLLQGYGAGQDAVIENDAVWDHELVRDALGTTTRERLRRLWGRRVALLDRLEALPHTFCHMDAIRPNLFSREGTNGEEETVAIDWAYVGIEPIGAEAAQLALGSVAYADPQQDIRALGPAALAAYLEGLREGGWTGDEGDAREGFALSAIRWVFMLRILNGAVDPERRAAQERWEGRPYDDIIARYGRFTRYLLDLIEGV